MEHETSFDNLGLFDSVTLDVRGDVHDDLAALAGALLDSSKPGAGWVRIDDEWLDAPADAMSVISPQQPASDVPTGSARLGLPDRGQSRDRPTGLEFVVSDERFKDVLLARVAGLEADLPESERGDTDDVARNWPRFPFWVRLDIDLDNDASRGTPTLAISYSLWKNIPSGLSPDGEHDGVVESFDVDEALVAIDAFEELATHVSLIGLFFNFYDVRISTVFGSRWLPPRSILIEPSTLTPETSSANYMCGRYAELAARVCSRFLQKEDLHDSSIAASVLQERTLCLHRQFSVALDSSQVFSKYCFFPLGNDVAKFEEEVGILVGALETLEETISQELWDISTDLEMAEAQFRVQKEMASAGSELVDALIVRLLESDISTDARWWEFNRRRRLRKSLAHLPDTLELVRRTLLQTEGERETALAMVASSHEKAASLQSFVRERTGQFLTQVPVDSYPSVTEALLTSEKFAQTARQIADRRADAERGATLRHLLETTTSVFGEERAASLEAVERTGSLLNLVLGLVALFTVVEFVLGVRLELTGAPAVVIRTVALLVTAGVLVTLAWLGLRNRRNARRVARSVVPELQDAVIGTVRLLRDASDRDDREPARTRRLDGVISASLADLFDTTDRLAAAVVELRAAFLARSTGLAPTYTDDETVGFLLERAPFLATYLSAEADKAELRTTGDIELLRVEVSLWSTQTLLYGERPTRMYSSGLPLTTAMLFCYWRGSIVSSFEVSNQMSEESFEAVMSTQARQPSDGGMSATRLALMEALGVEDPDVVDPEVLSGRHRI